MIKFKIGDIIKRENKDQYSHSSIYSKSFLISNVKNDEYILQQPNFYSNMSIKVVDSIFIIDENPKGFILDMKKHILKNLEV